VALVTVRGTESDSEPRVAVIVTAPGAIPSASPTPSNLAIDASEVDQVT